MSSKRLAGARGRLPLLLAAGVALTLVSACSPSRPLIGTATTTGGGGTNGDVSTAGPGSIQTFPVPTPASGLAGIAAGPDGLLWFTEQAASKVGSITTAGRIVEYPVPDPDAGVAGLQDTGPTEIVASGGAMWFLTVLGDDLYQIKPGGEPTDVFNPGDPYNAAILAPSSAGGVWLMMQDGDGNPRDGSALELVSPSGSASGYPASYANSNDALGLAPDGSIWYNNEGLSLNSVTTAVQERRYPLSPDSADQVSSIAFARNGTPYFTEYAPGSTYVPGSRKLNIPAKLPEAACCGEVGTISGGQAKILPIGVQETGDGLRPFSLINGPDGDLWFAFTGAAGGYDGIGRIDPSNGHVQVASTDPYVPSAIAVGADGALWFIDASHNLIGRIPVSQLHFHNPNG
jgi:streptogramin lyase